MFLGRDEKGIGRNRLVEVSLHDETKVQSDTVCDTVLRLDPAQGLRQPAGCDLEIPEGPLMSFRMFPTQWEGRECQGRS